MAKERKPSDASPLLPPVKGVTITEKNPHLKAVLIGIVLLVAVLAFGYAITNLLNGNTGWNEVSPDSATGITCADEVKLQYNFSDTSAAQRKKLVLVYSQASQDAYEVFNPSSHFDAVGNLYDISVNAGEEVSVHPALYKALEMSEKYNSRYIYMAPVYQVYDEMFFCDDDTQATAYDPARNSETAQYISDVMTFVSDPEHIQLELLDNNTVKLNISQEYLKFAKENGITEFLNFYWMKNAFVIDYIADSLSSEGFTKCYLYSIDGYIRCLDRSGESFSLNLFRRSGDKASAFSTLKYQNPISVVTYRNYPVGSGTDKRYYRWQDGSITTGYISDVDGLCASSIDELIATSRQMGCAELVMNTAPYFIKNDFDETGICALSEKSVVSLWWDGNGFKASGGKDFEIE